MADQTPAVEQQHEDTCDQPMKPEFWLEYWNSEEGRQLNHLEPHECLLKYVNKLSQGKKNLKIFVPLCGKSYDMKWLADEGHTVVGVELSPAVIQQFFELMKIDYTVSKIPSIELELYKSKDEKIRIYAGDFFLLSKDIESDFDAVWDSAALHSLPKQERQKYVELVKTLMSAQCCSISWKMTYPLAAMLSRKGSLKIFLDKVSLLKNLDLRRLKSISSKNGR